MVRWPQKRELVNEEGWEEFCAVLGEENEEGILVCDIFCLVGIHVPSVKGSVLLVE